MENFALKSQKQKNGENLRIFLHITPLASLYYVLESKGLKILFNCYIFVTDCRSCSFNIDDA